MKLKLKFILLLFENELLKNKRIYLTRENKKEKRKEK